MSSRRSTRETNTPARYGFSAADQPLPSTEYTLKEESEDSTTEPDATPQDLALPQSEDDGVEDFFDAHTVTNAPDSTAVDTPSTREPTSPVVRMEDLTPAQEAFMERSIATAVARAIAANSPSPEATPVPRALTADLQPSVDYYLPRLDRTIAAVEANKIKYPRLIFTDLKGDIDYDAWKMDMKLFIEEYSGNFTQGKAQVRAYFKCTGGEAKTIILQHMDPEFAGIFDSAADVLKALDQRFFDHNRVQAAKAKYYQLTMGSMTYNDFRIKFTSYATTGKIARSRWFEDVCEKISPALKREIKIEKYKMKNDYATLDEFLAIADRESRNITNEENLYARKLAAVATPVHERERSQLASILKKDNWRSLSPVAPTPDITYPAVRFRSTSPAPSSAAPSTTLAVPPGDCRFCKKSGHWMSDCPELAKHRQVSAKIAEIETDPNEGSEDLSKNS